MEGPMPLGRIGAALKPLIKRHGQEEVLREFRRYLDGMKQDGRAAFANPQDFASRYGYYKVHGVRVRRSNGRYSTTAPQTYEPGIESAEEIQWKR